MKTSKMSKIKFDSAVKIQGTEWDRKRRYTDKEVAMMKALYAGSLLGSYTVADIARMFHTYRVTVLYNVNPEYRKNHLARCSGKHTGVDWVDFNDRVNYKKKLVESKLIKVD